MVRKKIAYILGLMTLLFICFLCFHSVFSFKDGDGSYAMKTFYELEDNTVDVLVLGTSHAFEGINPAILWEDLGLAAYDLCGSKATMWNSYYYLEEALKTQSPQLVILDAFALVPTFEDDEDVTKYIKNTFGLKPSSTKWKAIQEATGDAWVSYALEYMQYHKRYTDLSDADFYPMKNDSAQFSCWLGYGRNYNIYPFDENYYENNYYCIDLREKEEEYYRKIISLCKVKNIPILILAVPYGGYSDIDMVFLNSGAMIAEEMEVPFVDFNLYLDVLGIDFQTDFADFNHLSYIGSDRFTHYLSKFLNSNFDLTFHQQDDSRYSRWSNAADYYKRDTFNHEITMIENTDEYWDTLFALPATYETLIIVPGVEEKKVSVNDVTISDDTNETAKESELWCLKNGQYNQLFANEYGYYFRNVFGHNELIADLSGIYWKKEAVAFSDTVGTRVLVFDTYRQCVVDATVVTNDSIYRRKEEE